MNKRDEIILGIEITEFSKKGLQATLNGNQIVKRSSPQECQKRVIREGIGQLKISKPNIKTTSAEAINDRP